MSFFKYDIVKNTDLSKGAIKSRRASIRRALMVMSLETIISFLSKSKQFTRLIIFFGEINKSKSLKDRFGGQKICFENIVGSSYMIKLLLALN